MLTTQPRTARARAGSGRVWPCVLAAALTGCAAGAIGPAVEPREYPAGVAHIRWRTVVHARGPGEPRPEECAGGALVDSRLVLGSRAGKVLALDTSDGHTLWTTPVTGTVDGEAVLDRARNQVYVGTDDGLLFAIDPDKGSVRWSFKARGALERPPEIGPDALYLTTASNQVVALDPAKGKSLWQYERQGPEGFTIHGYAGPRLGRGALFVGFTDGFLVALRSDTGELLWSRSLAAASEEYVDVDTTPVLRGDQVIAASYSGGLYAVRATDGEVVWRTGIEGASALHVAGDRIYVAAPREGLAALDLEGQVMWRQGMAQSGDLTAPREIGPYLVFTGSRSGLFIVERASGRLLQLFDPGRGMCAAPTIDPVRRELYVLANSGTLYALSLDW
jgi:outer membrane protein assembly factor BamB